MARCHVLTDNVITRDREIYSFTSDSQASPQNSESTSFNSANAFEKDGLQKWNSIEQWAGESWRLRQSYRSSNPR